MNIPVELEALRAEQHRLRAALDSLDQRISNLEFPAPAASEPAASPPPIVAGTAQPAPSIVPPDPGPIPTPAAIPAESAIGEMPLPKVGAGGPSSIVPPALPPEPRESLELRLGRVWLVRIGVVILLTGLVFLGNYAYHELVGRIGAGGKLALLYLSGAGLCALGGWLARRRESLQNYGRVLAAGGCATIYYATYAAHFVPALRVIESPLVGGGFLLALGIAFVTWADRLRSQTLAAATVALSFYAAAINPVATFSLFSNLVISVAAITLLARQRWVSVSLLSLLGTYGSFAFWRVQQTHTLLPTAAADSFFWASVLFPAGYWLVHTAAVLLRRVSTFDPSMRPVFLTLNNAALFALAGPVIAGTHPNAFWLAAALFGGALLVLSAIAARTAPEETFFDRSYLAQGLALVFVGLLYKFTGWQLALSFSLLSGTLVSMGRLRHGGVYRFFAGACALVAAYVALKGTVQSAEQARLVAYAVAAILTASAWLLRRNLELPQKSDWRAFAFILLAGLLVGPASLDASLPWSGVRILGIALVALVSLRLHRLPELAYIAQPLALGGQLVLVAHALLKSDAAMPAAISTAFALAFIHLWQWQTTHSLAGRRIWQTLHGLPPTILALTWSFQSLLPAERGPGLALLAILLLGYAFLTRTWIIAAFGAPFTLVACGIAIDAILEQATWLSPTAVIGLLAAQSLVLDALEKRAPIPPGIFLNLARALRGFALFLGVGMVFAYLSGHAWFLTLTGSALALFLIACKTRSREATLYAIAIGAVAAASWLGRLPLAPAQWQDLFGFAMVAAAQQIGRRTLLETGWLGTNARAFLSAATIFGVWILIHRLAGNVAGGFLITMSWSLLALVVLVSGFVLKERAYRLLGLVILAAAVGRIFFIDVWQLETLFRILSFLVLGAVLMALGFLYNRHAETLRRWL